MMRALGMLVSHLVMLGHVAEVDLGTGARERGVSPPGLVVSLTKEGDPLEPRPEAPSLFSRGPASSLGMTLAPLRFRGSGYQVSVLELEMTYETREGASGTALQWGLFGVGFSF
jgi:hypothetical protein